MRAAPAGTEWVHEIKHDGYRMLAVRHGRDVKLWSRQGHSWLKRLDYIRESLLRLPYDHVILDGEAVALDDKGLPDFHGLTGREGQANAVMYVWDLVFLEGVDLRSLPPTDRKARLKELVRKTDGLNFVDHIQGDGPRVFDHAYRMGLEGIISKLANRPTPWARRATGSRSKVRTTGESP